MKWNNWWDELTLVSWCSSMPPPPPASSISISSVFVGCSSCWWCWWFERDGRESATHRDVNSPVIWDQLITPRCVCVCVFVCGIQSTSFCSSQPQFSFATQVFKCYTIKKAIHYYCDCYSCNSMPVWSVRCGKSLSIHINIVQSPRRLNYFTSIFIYLL